MLSKIFLRIIGKMAIDRLIDIDDPAVGLEIIRTQFDDDLQRLRPTDRRQAEHTLFASLYMGDKDVYVNGGLAFLDRVDRELHDDYL